MIEITEIKSINNALRRPRFLIKFLFIINFIINISSINMRNMRPHLLLCLSPFFVVSSGLSMAYAEEIKPASQEKYTYPQEVIKTFMKGCGFTNSKEFCTCSLDKIRLQYNFTDFLKIDTAARETKQVPEKVITIFQSCRNAKI